MRIKETILKEYRKLPGVTVSDDEKRIDILLPGEKEDFPGKLTMMFPGGPILFNLIDIRNSEIPERVADPGISDKELKINYCISGRCELKTTTGECTYLTAGEISVDAGQALSTFYYPTGEYKGFEVVVSMANPTAYDFCLLGELFPRPEMLYELCKDFDYPWIRSADDIFSRFYSSFKYYTDHYQGTELILLECLELLTVLSGMDYSQANIRRTYYTTSQVEIAKRARKIIMSDLSVRFTAKTLAEEFGISETSLKNYFRSVYGCGYAEYQQIARMKKASEMLKETNDKVADIGQAVGYATQAKFGAAFKECFGVTPLEYRRRNRLEET